MRWFLLSMLIACGGGPDPILAGVPQPKTSTVAGAAAAIAGAATLAAPDAQAARVKEANRPDDNDKPIKSGPDVPADVLDRLDDQPASDEPAPPPPSERRPDPKAKKVPAKAPPPAKPRPTPIKPPTSDNPFNPGN